MSVAPTSPELAHLAREIYVRISSAQVDVAIAALIVYEYIITFDQEVSFFWERKKNAASWLFFAIRYLALLIYGILLGGIGYIPMSNDTCNRLQKAIFPIQILQYLLWATFSGLRTLALSNRNWWLASCVFLLASVYFAIAAWELSFGITGKNEPPVGCSGGPTLTSGEGVIAVAVSRSCGIAADLIVIVVTWRYTLRHRRNMGLRGIPSSLGRVLVVNGTMYFAILVALDIIQLAPLIPAFSPLYKVIQFFVFVDPLTPVLICRFMLALQSANQRAIRGQAFADGEVIQLSDTTHDAGTLQFAAGFVESFGGTTAAETEAETDITLSVLRKGGTTIGDSLPVDTGDFMQGVSSDGPSTA